MDSETKNKLCFTYQAMALIQQSCVVVIVVATIVFFLTGGHVWLLPVIMVCGLISGITGFIGFSKCIEMRENAEKKIK